jgi:iron(III) transport system permease protein
VLSFALLLPSLIVFVRQRYWMSRRYYVTTTGKSGAQTAIKSVSPLAGQVLLAICILLSL